MTKTTLSALRLLVWGLALGAGLATPVLAAPSRNGASPAVDICSPGTCVADALVVHRPPHRRPPAHHYRYHRPVHRSTVVVVRPVRPWVHRPYYGAAVAGVVIGTVIVASTVPPAPSPELCWYWSSSAQTRGYWDYCKPR